jgi:DNA gyrase/topoisomerase IV subunit B
MSKNTYEEIHDLSDQFIQIMRLRPGMYIGATDTPRHLASEVLDNSLDEALAGYCTRIEVEYKNGVFRVIDNGRGIPHGNMPDGTPKIVTIATKSHTGGKFNKANYGISAGLHGIGLTAVNAFTEYLTINSYRGKKMASAKFVDGNLDSHSEGKSLGTTSRYS